MGDRKKTSEVARMLGVPTYRLFNVMRSGKLAALPPKDSGGDYWWSPEDIARARAALATDRRRGKRTAAAGAAVATAVPA